MNRPDAQDESVVCFQSETPAQTRAWGERLGAALRPGQIVALQGDLGAGKTTLTQGIAVGLGISARVTSPTFTLVNEYDGAGGVRLIHMDSYRLGDVASAALAEAASFGMEEILDDPDAVIVIEWAERVQALLPTDLLLIELTTPADRPDIRQICCRAGGSSSQTALARLET